MVNEEMARKIIDKEIKKYEESLLRSDNYDPDEPTYNEAFVDGCLYILMKLKQNLGLES